MRADAVVRLLVAVRPYGPCTVVCMILELDDPERFRPYKVVGNILAVQELNLLSPCDVVCDILAVG